MTAARDSTGGTLDEQEPEFLEIRRQHYTARGAGCIRAMQLSLRDLLWSREIGFYLTVEECEELRLTEETIHDSF